MADCTDLTTLTNLNADQLAICLRARFLADRHFTYLSPCALVFTNPNGLLHSDSIPHIDVYPYVREHYVLESESLPPHPAQLASRAFYAMRRTGQDQSIVLQGKSNSGKGNMRHLVQQTLLTLGNTQPGKKHSKLTHFIPAAEILLNAFGCASTLANRTASKFGSYTELQFNEKNRLIGFKALTYHCDVKRAALPPKNERNFCIFYYLIAGATEEEAAHLVLDVAGQGGFHATNNTSYFKTGGNSEDAAKYRLVKEAFRALAFPKRIVSAIFKMLAAILHLGQITFMIDQAKNEEAAVVYNTDELQIAASLLGVSAEALEAALQVRTMEFGWDRVTSFLDPDRAADNRDSLSRALYALLFSWMADYINSKTSKEVFKSFISILDMPGMQMVGGSRSHKLDDLCFNLASERLHHFVSRHFFVRQEAEYELEGIASLLPALEIERFDNEDCIRILTSEPGGLVHIIDDQSKRKGKTDTTMLEACGKRWGNHPSFGCRAGDEHYGRSGTFSVNHFDGQVTYSVEDFLVENRAFISSDFITLLGGRDTGVEGDEAVGGSEDAFIKELFGSEVQKRKISTAPIARQSSLSEKRSDPHTKQPPAIRTTLGPLNESLTLLFEALNETRIWLIICLKPNDSGLPAHCDLRVIKSQIGSLGVVQLARRLKSSYSVSLTHAEFWQRYQKVQSLKEVVARLHNAIFTDKALGIKEELGWLDQDMVIGKHKSFLSLASFHFLEDHLRSQESHELKLIEEKLKQAADGEAGLLPLLPLEAPTRPNLGHNQNASQSSMSGLIAHADGMGYDTEKEGPFDDGASTLYAPSTVMFSKEKLAYDTPMPDIKKAYLNAEKRLQGVETVKQTEKRKLWVALTWLFTWWIPGFLLIWPGKMKRKDIRMAWREKLLINILIWLLCCSSIFVIAILGDFICPEQHIYTLAELQSHDFAAKRPFVAIRGEIFDLGKIAKTHQPAVVSQQSILKYAGRDASSLFPQQLSALCNGVDGSLSPWLTLAADNGSEHNAIYHDFRYSTDLLDVRPDWYAEQMIYMRFRFRVGFMGYTTRDVAKRTTKSQTRNTAIIKGMVFDLSNYIANDGGIALSPDGTRPPDGIHTKFMDEKIVSLFQSSAGEDVTHAFLNLGLSTSMLLNQEVCLRNLFYIGKVDTRGSIECLFSRYILLALSIFIVAIVGFKFLAALSFGSTKMAPSDAEKFVILQLPCYTEGEESLRRSIESLAALKYDDKRKLLCIVCDGNVTGAGNESTTPELVLKILGSEPSLEPEPLSYLALGEGSRQHNTAKLYSGLYEHKGHVCPYLVIVKVGKVTERSKPGNRGKRDSQVLLMRFFNKVHFNSPMNPLELQMFHEIKNVIGVNPAHFEYLLSIDADTEVASEALSKMVAAMLRDRRVIALCGETSISNARKSLITSLQVFEYFISHNLAKAFESFFGTVTCLPGCFSLFRIKTMEGKPLLCSHVIIDAFALNVVDTLHLKNLLHLGEDRYLTSCLLKNFPHYKTTFVRDASATTAAPESWKVLLSQRRRWINSTVHNLFELFLVDAFCGMCCFSMRFVVLIDLISTLVSPVTVVYIGWLIYQVVAKGSQFPLTAIIMLGCIYGLQAVIFILRGRFEMVGWLVIYICAIPLFSCVIPLYAFWHMDSFTWGSTRQISGEKGKRRVIHEEGYFDKDEIPLQTWAEYEDLLWENGSNQSIGNIIENGKRRGKGDQDSIYGYHHDSSNQLSPTQSRAGTPAGYPTKSHTPPLMEFGFAPPGAGLPRSHSSQFLDEFSSDLQLGVTTSVRAPFGTMPPDEQIKQDIGNLIETCDLNSMSKKSLRAQLALMYGLPDMGIKTMKCNQWIEESLN